MLDNQLNLKMLTFKILMLLTKCAVDSTKSIRQSDSAHKSHINCNKFLFCFSLYKLNPKQS